MRACTPASSISSPSIPSNSIGAGTIEPGIVQDLKHPFEINHTFTERGKVPRPIPTVRIFEVHGTNMLDNFPKPPRQR